MIESEIKTAWKCGFVAALRTFSNLAERGDQFLWMIAEAEWQEIEAQTEKPVS